MTSGVTAITRDGGKQVYRIAFSYRGVQCREIVALTHSKANETYCRRLRDEVLGKIERNDFRYADYFPDSKRASTFDARGAGKRRLLKDALEAYRDRVQATFTPSTFAQTRKAVDNTLVPWCGNVAIGDFRPAAIREWVPLQTCSLKRLRNVLLPLRAVLAEAVHDEIIDSNPFDRINLAKLLPEAQRRSTFEPQPYTVDELRRLLQAMPEPTRYAFQLWAFTGLRTGELIGLRWPRVDLQGGTIKVMETTVDRKDKATPKTPSGVRTITLLPAAREALERLHAAAKPGQVRVAVNPRSWLKDPAWDDRTLARAWAEAHTAAEIAYRNPYQLRHTFASNLLSQGDAPAYIARLLGHKTVEMVIRVYARWVAQGEAIGTGAAPKPSERYGAAPLWTRS